MYILGDSTSITSDLSEERSEDKESDLQCDETFVDRDVKNRQSDYSSSDQNVTTVSCDECCVEKSIKCTQLDKSIVEIDGKNSFKSIGYQNRGRLSRNTVFKKINVEESLQKCLPDHLRLLVQKHLDDLMAQERNEC